MGMYLDKEDLDRRLQEIWFNPLDSLEIIGCDSIKEEDILPEVKEVWEWETYVSVDFPLSNGKTGKLEAQRYVKRD